MAKRSIYKLSPIEKKVRDWTYVSAFRRQNVIYKSAIAVGEGYIEDLQKLKRILKKRGFGKGTPVYDQLAHDLEQAEFALRATNRAYENNLHCIREAEKK